jgi:hypothetical protein
MTFVIGSIAGVVATLGVGAAVGVESLPGIVATAVGGMAATYGVLLATWRRLAHRSEARGKVLFERVVDAVSEQIADQSSTRP